jgi:hypothetical protein
LVGKCISTTNNRFTIELWDVFMSGRHDSSHSRGKRKKLSDVIKEMKHILLHFKSTLNTGSSLSSPSSIKNKKGRGYRERA